MGQFYQNQGAANPVAIEIGELAPFEIRDVDLSKLQQSGVIPSAVSSGSLKIEHFGPDGALMGRVFSASRERGYGFYLALESHGGSSLSGVYWSIEGDWNSMLTVANFGDENENVHVELTYSGGRYLLPVFPLLPLESKTLDLRESSLTRAKTSKEKPYRQRSVKEGIGSTVIPETVPPSGTERQGKRGSFIQFADSLLSNDDRIRLDVYQAIYGSSVPGVFSIAQNIVVEKQ